MTGAGDGSDDEDVEDEFSDLENEDEEDDEANPDVDALEADEESMKKSLAELAQKDPEFFKYLQDNDADLLDFENADDMEDDEEEQDELATKAPAKAKGKKSQKAAQADAEEEMEYDAASGSDDEPEPEFGAEEVAIEKVSVTMKMLRAWQRAMIEHNSLRSLRKMILAFRAAAHMNQDDEDEVETKYKIDSAQGELTVGNDSSHLSVLTSALPPLQYSTSSS